VLVAEGDGQAVDLRLDDELDLVAAGQLVDAGDPGA
jgi:hypothetical protein